MLDKLTHDREITPQQSAALSLIRKRGSGLAEKSPEIADDYRQGMTCNKIAEKYNVQGVTPEIAENAVRFALAVLLTDDERDEIRERFSKIRGAKFGNMTYERGTGLFGMTDRKKKKAAREGGKEAAAMGVGIHALTRGDKQAANERSREIQKEKGTGIYGLTPDERRKIGKKYGSAGGKKGGATSKERGVGVHAMTREELSRAGKKGGHAGGLISGPKNYKKKIGIHALSDNERSANGRKGIQMTLLSQGKTSWDSKTAKRKTRLSESGYLLQLSRQTEFVHGEGRGRATGRPDYKKITEKLNEVFHSGEEIRTIRAVRSHFQRLLK